MTDATLVRMPKLADTLVEGTLGRWLKQVGESVSQGEPLASIETDKVTTDLTSPAAGTLLELLVGEGQTVAVETPIARIGAPSSSSTVAPPPKPTPVAARLLAEHGLAPDQVAHAGRVKKADVLNFVGRNTKTTPLTSMRRAIAEHMTRASQSIPHGQTVMDADLTELVTWRESHKSEGITFTVLFVSALAHELATVVEAPVDVGVAVALEHGLIVPVLRDVDRLSLPDLARALTDVAARARNNQLKPDEMQGARMTVTNVGSFGNLTASPIIPLGQIGILAPGLVERRPLPGPNGAIRPGWRCLLSLMFDRRAFDDLAADRFLRGAIRQLRAPVQ
jgi:pyruvate/2-oxoglutarate dehydrogenase complex dihydrolipoamide acyltransferase (E2) component